MTEPKGLRSVAPGWAPLLTDAFEAPTMDGLRSFLQKEYREGRSVFPPKQDIFRALRLVGPEEIKVFVVGQDPYHGPGQANGLAFAVGAGVRPPPSLVNIFQELANDLQVPVPRDPSLVGWAQQGVLLLNSVLTVRAREAFSHRNQGWEVFTASVVEAVSRHCQNVVFILWGSSAQKQRSLIDEAHHHVIASPHPSPLSAHRGFFGSRPFSRANAYLEQCGRKPIAWHQTGAIEEVMKPVVSAAGAFPRAEVPVL